MIFLISSFSCNQKSNIPTEIPLTVVQDSAVAQRLAKESRENIAARIASGLTLNLWASDSLAPDPIAMSIDDTGNIYLTRTNRQKNSEFDIRGFRDWMTPSISFQTVEERRAFLRETFAPELSEKNNWLPDLNADGVHDWKDLSVQKEEVWMLEDLNKDGLADISKRILEDFHDEITDVAGALLVRNNDVFIGVGPDMWRLVDANKDQVLDSKTSIAHGFAVHIGFGGHGMSGAIEGPDGKIYWGIGDIGASITTVDGKKYHLPNQGMIVRANPDGSDFEVFARGLRNTHEFVFDAYGNIISSDNDGDHQGESERLVHIVEGSDAGWRTNWQYGKYTDSKNNGYNVWMDEKLYLPRWEGQAAYIIPPIQNYHNGPTGMIYNPGTALGKEWLNRFFLVEFVGDPSRSHIWSFTLKPKGASFELDEETDVLSGVLPTGIRFGPDGALYLADWINGWDTKNYGRVWKLDVTSDKNDLENERLKTQRLMTFDYRTARTKYLLSLLRYEDMRIRQKAQFELANRGFWGYRALKKVLQEEENQLARIHAIWGLGQLTAKKLRRGASLLPLLLDKDPEIIAQAAKVLGDVHYQEAGEELLPLLTHENDRVKFYAAQALGRLKYNKAVQPLLAMLEANKDKDVYLRHAAVLALARMGDAAPIISLASSENTSLRLAAVLILRRLQHPELALFLKDTDEYIVTEAARAINDDSSIPEALPALAALLRDNHFTSEALLRRSINAALRVGSEQALDDLIAFAKKTQVASHIRGEALAAIGAWPEPSVLDRVDGRLRGAIRRDPSLVKQKIAKDIPALLEDRDENILIGTFELIGLLGIEQYNEILFSMLKSHKLPNVRASVLTALGNLNFAQMKDAMQLGMKDRDQGVRAAAVGLLAKLELSEKALAEITEPIFTNASTREQQRMLQVLGELPIQKSKTILSTLIRKGIQNDLEQGIILDLIEAVEVTEDTTLLTQLASLKKEGYTADAYKEALYGGSWWPGQVVFKNNPTAQCVRCHALKGAGGKVGPAMDGIADLLSREQLLESLVEPSKRLAPGYGNVKLTLKDGQIVSGLLLSEDVAWIVLRTSEAEPLKIARARIRKRENMPSSMPAVGRLISKRELRDLIEFLASLKNDTDS